MKTKPILLNIDIWCSSFSMYLIIDVFMRERVVGIGCAKKVLHSPILLSNVELVQTHYVIRPCAYRL